MTSLHLTSQTKQLEKVFRADITGEKGAFLGGEKGDGEKRNQYIEINM